MKKLLDSSLLGRGTKRLVYIDPDDNSKCIKILLGKASIRDAKREEKYFNYLQKKEISFDHLVSYYGKIETNKGEGYCFDLCRDFDGKISGTLASYLNNNKKFILLKNILEEIQILKTYIEKNRIFVGDPNLKNILYQRLSSNTGKLVIVDGIGNSELIPVSNYIDYFAKRKINRIFQRFYKKLLKHKNYRDLITNK